MKLNLSNFFSFVACGVISNNHWLWLFRYVNLLMLQYPIIQLMLIEMLLWRNFADIIKVPHWLSLSKGDHSFGRPLKAGWTFSSFGLCSRVSSCSCSSLPDCLPYESWCTQQAAQLCKLIRCGKKIYISMSVSISISTTHIHVYASLVEPWLICIWY